MNLPPLPPTITVQKKSLALSPLKLGPAGNAFYDDFATSNSRTNWSFYQGSNSFTSGRLQLTVAKDAGMYAWVKNGNWTNVSVSADIKLDTTSTWGAAIGVRHNGSNGINYQAWIYGSGKVAIEKYPSDWYNGWSEIVSATVPVPGIKTNNVQFTITNNVLKVYVNGTQYISYTDTASPIMSGGSVNLGVWGSGGQCRAYFDNVTVYSFDTPAVITTNPPVLITGLTNYMTLQGSNVTFTVTATGNPLTYTWITPKGRFVGINTYTVTNVQSSDAGVYRVYITNTLDKVFSWGYLAVGTTNTLTNCTSTVKTSATLSWCPSPGTNEIVNYKVYYGSGAMTNWTPDVYDTNQPPCPGVIVRMGTNWCRCYTNTVSSGTNLTATVSNLVAGVTYYFSATATDTAALESDYSSEVSLSIPLPVMKPITNAIVRITSLTGGLVQLQTKLCPFAKATVLVKTNLLQVGWNIMATNVTADSYGNFVYVDSTTAPMKFYKLQMQ